MRFSDTPSENVIMLFQAVTKSLGWRVASSPGRIILGAVLLAMSATGQQAPRPEFETIVDQPGLPRVLIIGDSISIGYTLPLRAALDGIANVHRPPENCAHTWKGLDAIERWLGEGKWDLIHFNWGLHDLKFVDAQGKLALPPRGKQVSTVGEYAANLERLVRRLQQTGAKLIWRPTTPVPEGAQGRVALDLPRYNAAAREVVERHGIEIDEMNSFIRDRNIPHIRPDNVHFSRDSSALLAGNTAELIRRKLQSD